MPELALRHCGVWRVNQSMVWLRRRSREEPPTLTVRLPAAVTHLPSFVDQYCNWRGATCSVTVFDSPACEVNAVECDQRSHRELHASGNLAGRAKVDLRHFVGSHAAGVLDVRR